MKTFFAQTVHEWRDWLAHHHESESDVWLIFHKLHTGVASIDYSDALDEALCFGWVDSLVKRLDDRRYARKFTPRRADSRWSAANRQRYAELKASGRFELPAKLPPYIQTALRKRPAAWRFFEALAPSHRRRYVGWIESAKRRETKERRLKRGDSPACDWRGSRTEMRSA